MPKKKPARTRVRARIRMLSIEATNLDELLRPYPKGDARHSSVTIEGTDSHGNRIVETSESSPFSDLLMTALGAMRRKL